MSHERRMDRIADQFASALRQFFRELGRYRQRHILELPHPAHAILRRDDQTWPIRPLAPPRCQSVPFVIASDPDGIISFTASARLPKSLFAFGAVSLLKSAGFTAPSTICPSHR